MVMLKNWYRCVGLVLIVWAVSGHQGSAADNKVAIASLGRIRCSTW